MQPTVGRILHYRDAAGAGPFAAIVTAAKDGEVTLLVLLPSGQQHVIHAAHEGDGGTSGCWAWPEREPAPEDPAGELPAKRGKKSAG